MIKCRASSKSLLRRSDVGASPPSSKLLPRSICRALAKSALVWLAITAAVTGPTLSTATRLAVRDAATVVQVGKPLARKRSNARWHLGFVLASQIGRSIGENVYLQDPPPSAPASSSPSSFASPLEQSGKDPSSGQRGQALSSMLPKERNAAIEAFGRLGDIEGLCDALQGDDVDTVKHALETLVSLEGNRGVDAIQAIYRLSTGSEGQVHEAALGALDVLKARVWPGGIQSLRQAARDGDAQLRIEAIERIGRLGVLAEEDDVTLLKEALKDDDSNARFYAARSIAALELRVWGSFSELRKAAHGEDVYLRRAAIATLGSFLHAGHVDEFDVQDLHIALADEDSEVRTLAASMLTSVGPLPGDIMASLRSMIMNEEDQDGRASVLMDYPFFQHSLGVEDIAALTKALQDSVAGVRSAAQFALTHLGMEAWPNGLVGIREALNSNDVWISRAASYALAVLKGPEPFELEVDDVFRAALENDDPYVRCAAASLLDQPLISVWLAGLPEVRLASQSSDSYLRRSAIGTLVTMGESLERQDLDIIFRAMGHDVDWTVRYLAAYTSRVLNGVDGVIAALENALNDDSEEVRDAAMESMDILLHDTLGGGSDDPDDVGETTVGLASGDDVEATIK